MNKNGYYKIPNVSGMLCIGNVSELCTSLRLNIANVLCSVYAYTYLPRALNLSIKSNFDERVTVNIIVQGKGEYLKISYDMGKRKFV